MRNIPAKPTPVLIPSSAGEGDATAYRADGGGQQAGRHGDVEERLVGILAVGGGAGHVGDVDAQVELPHVPAVLQHLGTVQPVQRPSSAQHMGGPPQRDGETPTRFSQHSPGWAEG